MNTHFYAFLMQAFLSGYNKPCEIRMLLMVVPILLYKESREKLVRAKSSSKLETVFQNPREIHGNKISGKTRLAGYIDRYNTLKPYCKESIIILSSEEKIALSENKIIALSEIDYKKVEGKMKDWARCAYYLGIIFSQTTVENVNYFLGVDEK